MLPAKATTVMPMATVAMRLRDNTRVMGNLRGMEGSVCGTNLCPHFAAAWPLLGGGCTRAASAFPHCMTDAVQKLLLVEDSERLLGNLVRGFTMDVAGDGMEPMAISPATCDFMVLDLGLLPRLDGFGVLRTLPTGGERPRVLVLPACDQVGDRVDALNAGATTTWSSRLRSRKSSRACTRWRGVPPADA